MLKTVKIFFTFFILITLFYCCRDEVCTSSMNSKVNINFYTNKSKAKSIPVFSAYGIGRSDSLLYKNKTKISSIGLPLDQNNDESKFIMYMTLVTDTIFKPDTNIIDSLVLKTFIDTMVIHYSRKIEMISPECGFVTIFELNNILTSHNAIDSCLIKLPTINIDNNEENVKIFL
jgi:hypothetical protein